MTCVATLIADMVRAGVCPDLIGRTAAALADVATAPKAPELTKRQARNARYYDGQKERLKASDSDGDKTIKTVSDAVKTPLPPNGPSPSPAPLPHPLNPPTPRSGAVAEADTPIDGDKPVEIAKPKSLPASMDYLFGRFWEAYPSRGSASNPKQPARDKFERAVKSGVDPVAIIAAAGRYAAIEISRGNFRTDKIAQALTWLNQRRWQDYAEEAPSPSAEIEAAGMFHVMAGTAEWDAWREHRGKSPPLDAKGGWAMPSQWPPGWPKSETAELKAPPSDVFAFDEDSS